MSDRPIGFEEMARALARHARDDAHVFSECEKLAARLSDPNPPLGTKGPPEAAQAWRRPGLERELDALRRRAAAVAASVELVRALAPFERPLRALIAFNGVFRRLFGRRNQESGRVPSTRSR
jgi:hypothetical protein